MSFVHLHVHTKYSMADGMSDIRELFQKAEEYGMPGLAITDHATMAGVPEFLSVAVEHPSVKPIIGCEFWIEGKGGEQETRHYHLILLAKNYKGYKNLVSLCSYANTEGRKLHPVINREILLKHREGIICTSACIGGEIPQLLIADNHEAALKAAHWYRDTFGDDFYLEVSLHEDDGMVALSSCDLRSAYEERNRKLVSLQSKADEGIFQLADELGIKVVATNDVHFVKREDAIAQDILLCINGRKRVSDLNRRRYSHLEYLKTEDEMRLVFPEHPETIDNTLEILDKVGRYLIWQKTSLPCISKDPENELKAAVEEGALIRYGDISRDLRKRLDKELNAIASSGSRQYFLIMKDLVDHEREKGVIVNAFFGGAAVRSIVCYCLGITEIDPIRFGLNDDWFLNNPDADRWPVVLNTDEGGRCEIINYLKEKYGESQVLQIATYSRPMRLAWEYSATAFGIPETTIWRTMRQTAIWWKRSKEELIASPTIDFDKETEASILREAYDAAVRLSDVYGVRMGCPDINLAGILVGTGPLAETVPVTRLRNGCIVSQYAARWARKAGVLEIDVDEKSELTIIRQALEKIRSDSGESINLMAVGLDDTATLELFASGDTVGIYMFEDGSSVEEAERPGIITFNDIVSHFVHEWRFQFSGGAENNINHSLVISRALGSYLMAWLKAHYPKAFFESLLNNSICEGTETLERYESDCMNHGFTVISPENSKPGYYKVI